MGFRFRRSIRLGKGLRINLSKSGASLSVGRRGATVNIGPKGQKLTIGIPGTGLSYSKRLPSGASHAVRARQVAMPNSRPPKMFNWARLVILGVVVVTAIAAIATSFLENGVH